MELWIPPLTGQNEGKGRNVSRVHTVFSVSPVTAPPHTMLKFYSL